METQSYFKSVMDWIQMTSPVVAWIALVLSLIKNRTAKKAYLLALKQEKRREPSLGLYVIDSYIRAKTSSTPRIFVFQIGVTNTSDAGNAIRELELVIEHGRDRKVGSSVNIPHDPGLLSHVKNNRLRPFDLPCSIEPRTVLKGLAIFAVPEKLIKNSRVESYTVNIVDTFGLRAGQEVILLKEAVDEQNE